MARGAQEQLAKQHAVQEARLAQLGEAGDLLRSRMPSRRPPRSRSQSSATPAAASTSLLFPKLRRPHMDDSDSLSSAATDDGAAQSPPPPPPPPPASAPASVHASAGGQRRAGGSTAPPHLQHSNGEAGRLAAAPQLVNQRASRDMDRQAAAAARLLRRGGQGSTSLPALPSLGAGSGTLALSDAMNAAAVLVRGEARS